MHRGMQWPEPRLTWPDGKLICCTFRVAYEAFRESGRFKKSAKIKLNVASLSHANYGGAVGIWRLMEVLDRNGIRATIGANGLAVEKGPETIQILPPARHQIASPRMTHHYHMTHPSPQPPPQAVRNARPLIRAVH